MKKVLLSILGVIFLLANSINASDNNKTISDEEFMKQWEQLEKKKKEAIDKTTKTELQLKKSEKELEASKKIGKTLDELLDKVDKLKNKE